MTAEIIFIGTSHIDPDGYGRLSRILERDRPDLILLEVSPMSIILRRTFGFAYRLILNRNLKALNPVINPEIRNIMSYLDIPFEYTAAREYCARTGAVYRLADVSIISLAKFFHAYKLISKKNISAAAMIHEDRFRQERVMAAGIFSRDDRMLINMKVSQFKKDRLALYRENILLRRVSRLVRRNRRRRIAYIGGWEHLIDAPGSGLLYTEFPLKKMRIITFMDNENI